MGNSSALLAIGDHSNKEMSTPAYRGAFIFTGFPSVSRVQRPYETLEEELPWGNERGMPGSSCPEEDVFVRDALEIE
jgi:hypothetical protein